MRFFDELPEARAVSRSPLAGLGLAFLFYGRPRIVGPSPVVGGAGVAGGASGHGSKDAEAPAVRYGVMERCLLHVVGPREHHDRLAIQLGEFARVLATLDGGGEPRFVLAQQLPNGAMMFRLVAFEIEIENDRRPAFAVTLAKFLLHDGPDALEEVLAHPRLRSGELFFVREDGPSVKPGQILFDGNGRALGQRALDPLGPLAILGVAVVGVEQHARGENQWEQDHLHSVP